MKLFLLSIGSLVFLISVIAHVYVKITLRPPKDSDFDDIYWEFQETHPGFGRYNRLSHLTFIAAIIGALLLFLAVIF